MSQHIAVVFAVILIVVLAGCGGTADTVNQPENNSTAVTPPTPTETGDDTASPMDTTDEPTPERTSTGEPQVQTSNGTVAVASMVIRVTPNETKEWTYRGQDGTIIVNKTTKKRKIVIEMEDYRKELTYNLSDSSSTESWSQDNLRFVVRPVNMEKRDGQPVYLFGDTWNTTHVELEIFCTHDC